MPSKRGRGADPDRTRRNLLDAAITTLDRDGYAGATARAVAAEAGCNQASIYYHFGGITELLVAAIVDSNDRRFAAYRAAIEPLHDPAEIIAAWQELHDEDVRSGHIGAMTELVGATGAEPRLREGVTRAVGAWRDLVSSTVRRAVAGGPLAGVVPVDEATDLILAAFLGVELLGHLDGDHARAGRLFAAGRALAGLLPAPASPRPEPDRQGNAGSVEASPAEPFRTRPAAMGVPAVNLDRAVQLAAEIEDDELVRNLQRGK